MASKRSRHIYGRHPVSEALRSPSNEIIRVYVASAGRSTRLSDVVRLAEKRGIPVVQVPQRQLVDLVGDVPHQGVVAAVDAYKYSDIDTMLRNASRMDQAPLVLALDQVQDPHNLGAIVRSGLALGAHGVLIPKDRACEVTPTVVKSSAGATAHMPIAQVTNLKRAMDELRDAGLWICGTVADGGEALESADLAEPTVLVVGSEGKGLRRTVADSCDRLLHIPMAGSLGSLNASVAAAIVLYEAGRQRRT